MPPWGIAPCLVPVLQIVLAPYDRVGIGGELLLFRWKAIETPESGPILTAEAAVMEFKKSMQVLMQVLVMCTRRHGAVWHSAIMFGLYQVYRARFDIHLKVDPQFYIWRHSVGLDVHFKAQTHCLFPKRVVAADVYTLKPYITGVHSYTPSSALPNVSCGVWGSRPHWYSMCPAFAGQSAIYSLRRADTTIALQDNAPRFLETHACPKSPPATTENLTFQGGG